MSLFPDNNQYLVVDFGRFTPGEALAEGTLWIIEQVPGLVESGDATAELERGYFPSYNVPYFSTIYDRSGYTRCPAWSSYRKRVPIGATSTHSPS